MELAKEQLNSIAQDLQCGFNCYIHIKTLQVVKVLKGSDLEYFDDDENPFLEDMKIVEADEKNFIEIEPMSSRDGFEIMESFVENLKDKKFAQMLSNELEKRKPFARFKHEVHNSEHREDWFKHEIDCYEKYVASEFQSEMSYLEEE